MKVNPDFASRKLFPLLKKVGYAVKISIAKFK